MDSDQFFKQMIPIKLVKFLKFLVFYGIIQNTVLEGLMMTVESSSDNAQFDATYSGFINRFPYQIVFGFAANLLLQFYLFLYYLGLNSICHYWQQKRWESYDQYGENERMHQQLIDITQSTTCVLISCLSTVHIYVLAHHGMQIVRIGYVLARLLDCIDNITCCLAIYCIYPFGHVLYRKMFGTCYDKIYAYFKNRLRTQVGNKSHNNIRYKRYQKCCTHCGCCTKDNIEFEIPLLPNC